MSDRTSNVSPLWTASLRNTNDTRTEDTRLDGQGPEAATDALDPLIDREHSNSLRSVLEISPPSSHIVDPVMSSVPGSAGVRYEPAPHACTFDDLLHSSAWEAFPVYFTRVIINMEIACSPSSQFPHPSVL
jgi:hypothetical protein